MPTIVVSVTVTDAGGHVGTASASATIGFTTERSFRESLEPGTYVPDASNSGCYDDSSYPGGAPVRTVVASHTPVAGGVYENLIIQGTVVPPVGTGFATYRNVEFQGPAGTGHLVKAYDTNRIRLDCYDCTWRPRVPDSSRTGIIGKNFRLYRPDISYVVDGIRVQNTSDPDGPALVEIYAPYIHDLFWQADANDGTHSDGVQIESGSGGKIIGGNIQGFIAADYRPNFYGTSHANAALMIKPDVGLISSWEIRLNKIDGGAISVNVANDAPDRILGSIGTVSDNLFGTNTRLAGWPMVLPVSASATITTGNTRVGGGVPNIRRQG
jgi:hypothetical protein